MLLETERLIIRRLTDDDFVDFFVIAADKEMCRLMGRADLTNIINARITFNWLKDREECGCAIILKETGQFIGNLTVSISAVLRASKNGQCNTYNNGNGSGGNCGDCFLSLSFFCCKKCILDIVLFVMEIFNDVVNVLVKRNGFSFDSYRFSSDGRERNEFIIYTVNTVDVKELAPRFQEVKRDVKITQLADGDIQFIALNT